MASATATQYLPLLWKSGRSRSCSICSAVFCILPGASFEIRHIGLGAQLAQQLGAAIGARQPRDFAVGIVQVAEDQGLWRRTTARKQW